MTTEDITELVESFEGVLTLAPGPGDGSPEIAWGDTFFYYSRDGVTPSEAQPFATIVIKDYPGDARSCLDRDGVVRVNVAAGKDAFVRWAGHSPGPPSDDADLSVADTVFAHPVYGSLGWLAVVNPGPQTSTATRDLLRQAYDLARAAAFRGVDRLTELHERRRSAARSPPTCASRCTGRRTVASRYASPR